MTEPGTPHPFLAALIESWPAVLAELDEGRRTALIGLVRSADPPMLRLARIRQSLMSALPPDGPASRALFAGVSVRLAPAAAGTSAMSRQFAQLTELIDLAAGLVADPPEADPPAPEDRSPAPRSVPQGAETGESWRYLHAQVREQLSQLEWRRPDQTVPSAEAGVEGMIILRFARDDVRLPEFQFDPGGRALPVVARVNRLLGASQDPWAVACWWVGRHRWFQAAPVDLVGERDDELVDAARAVRDDLGRDDLGRDGRDGGY